MDLGSPGRIKVDKLDTETGVCWPAAKSFFSCHKSQQHLWGDRLHLVVSGRLSGRWLPVFTDNSIVHWPNCSLPSSTWSPPRAGIAGHTTMPQNIYFSPITAKKKQPKEKKKKTCFSTLFSWQHKKVGLLSSRRALYVWPKPEKCFWYMHLVTWYTSLQTAGMIMQCGGKFWSLLNLDIFIYHRPSLLSSNLWSLLICRLYFANKTRQIRDWDRKGDVWTPSLSRPCSVGENKRCSLVRMVFHFPLSALCACITCAHLVFMWGGNDTN